MECHFLYEKKKGLQKAANICDFYGDGAIRDLVSDSLYLQVEILNWETQNIPDLHLLIMTKSKR